MSIDTSAEECAPRTNAGFGASPRNECWMMRGTAKWDSGATDFFFAADGALVREKMLPRGRRIPGIWRERERESPESAVSTRELSDEIGAREHVDRRARQRVLLSRTAGCRNEVRLSFALVV